MFLLLVVHPLSKFLLFLIAVYFHSNFTFLSLSPSFSSLCGRKRVMMSATLTRSSQRCQWSWHQQTSSSSWTWTRTSSKASPTPTLNMSYKSEEIPSVGCSPDKTVQQLTQPTSSKTHPQFVTQLKVKATTSRIWSFKSTLNSTL